MAACLRNAAQYGLGLAMLTLALLVAEQIKDGLALAVPVPVLAVLVLLALFIGLGRVPHSLRRVSQLLLPHMALFFIPVLVGLLALWDGLRDILLPLALIIIVSTVLPLWATAYIFQKYAPPLDSIETPSPEASHADE